MVSTSSGTAKILLVNISFMEPAENLLQDKSSTNYFLTDLPEKPEKSLKKCFISNGMRWNLFLHDSLKVKVFSELMPIDH